jgi:probable O-glycosylation ligase (exosortase A-associated)
MLIPLMYYLYQTASQRWVRNVLIFSIVACGFSILGSHSRGALLAVLVAGAFLAIKSRRRALTAVIVASALASMIAFMPSRWDDRMETIANYQEDSSAQGRLYAWQTIWNLAKDRPIVGGGFDIATPEIYQRYAPVPDGGVFSPHSVYFQALGEHGFVGLFLFLTFAVVTWRTATRLSKECDGRAGYEWVPILMRMIHVSLLGFGVGGAFLGLLHYDLPYYLATIVVLVGASVREEDEARTMATNPPQGRVLQA